MKSAIVAAIVLSAACTNLSASSRELSDEFSVPGGLEVTLWAESPLFYKPTNIDIDARGRVWVAEGVNYRTFRGKDVNQPETIGFRHPDGDRIMILEDTNGDGVADSSKVFVQDKDLVAPLGVAVIGNRVFVSCSPHLLVYTLDETGDKPALKEIFLTGFGGRDHDHGLHSVAGGPDGRLYFNAGNAGPHLITDRSGKTIRAGSIYTGGSPYNTTNSPNMKSDDGRVWTGGLALRIDTDGRNLTPIAHNFRNSYEVTINSFGDLWQSDNDDEVRACRTSWLMEAANMGFFSADGTRTWRADQRPGQSIQTAHWHQEDPGVTPPGDVYGAGGPTGLSIYEGELLPKNFLGMVLNCDAGRNTVFGHVPHPDGAGYRLERTIFISSRRGSTEEYRWDKVSIQDKSTWFRPSDVAVGTDGAVYVADWFDPVVGGHAMRNQTGYGRILRISPKGIKPRSPSLDLNNYAGQLASLKSPAINVRFAAREKIATSEINSRRAAEELSQSENPLFRARAAWFPTFWDRALVDRDDRVRVAAWRAARQHLAATPEKLLSLARRLATGSSPALRREIAIMLRDFPFSEDSAAILTSLAERFDGKDRYYLEAIGLGSEGKEEFLYPALLGKIGNSDPLKWSDAFATLIWRLHPVGGVAAIVQRARAYSLPAPARIQAVNTLAFIRDPSAAEAMSRLAATGPEDIRPAALWWARFRAGNDWKQFDLVEHLPDMVDAKQRESQTKIARLRKTLCDQNASRELREQAAVALAETEEGGIALLNLAAGGQLPREFQDTVAEIIFRNPSPAVGALASQYFKRPSRSGEAFPPMKDLLGQRGDPNRGQIVFYSEIAGCAKCHAFAGAGGEVGPDLTTARTKLGREGILDSILNPSAVIAAGYEPWIIETADGETHSGFILSDGDTITLREPSGSNRSIPAKQIASRRQQKLSLMPDNIALGLSSQELVDLVEFLLNEAVEPARSPER